MWVTVYLIRSKFESFGSFKNHLSTSERQTGSKKKFLLSGGGGEYVSTEFQSYLTAQEIHSRSSCSYSLQQNEITERMNWTFIELKGVMLEEKRIAKEFWANAVVSAAYIIRRLPCRGIPADKTPFKI